MCSAEFCQVLCWPSGRHSSRPLSRGRLGSAPGATWHGLQVRGCCRSAGRLGCHNAASLAAWWSRAVTVTAAGVARAPGRQWPALTASGLGPGVVARSVAPGGAALPGGRRRGSIGGGPPRGLPLPVTVGMESESDSGSAVTRTRPPARGISKLGCT
jgi:hypothetical protein